MRKTFLDNLSTARPRQAETGGGCIVSTSVMSVDGTRCDVDDEDIDDDEDDVTDTDDEDDDDEDDEEDDEEEETWQVHAARPHFR